MSVVKGFNSPITMFDDVLNAVDEELAELEAAAGQSEDEDLYAGLQCDAERDDEGSSIVVRQQRQQIQELQTALAQKDENITSLQEALAAKGDAVQQLAAQRLVLLTNISSLFKTAQAEIKRHTTQLQSTRLELVQLKAQLARAQRQPSGQAKAAKQQQLPLPPRQQHQQQHLPPPPGQQQQQQLGQALHDISGSLLNQQLHAAQQAKQGWANPTGTQLPQQPPQQQQQQQRHGSHTQHRGQQQRQPPSHAGPGVAGSCKRCRSRSSSPHRSHSSRPEETSAVAAGLTSNKHKQQKQHAGAGAGAGTHSSRPSSNSTSSRPANSHHNVRHDCNSRPDNSSSSAGRAGDVSRAGAGSGSSSGNNTFHNSGSGRSRSPGRDASRGVSRAAAGGYRDGQRAGSPDRRQDRRRN